MYKLMLKVEKWINEKCQGIMYRYRVFYWRRLLGGSQNDFTIFGPIKILHPENVYLGKKVAFSTGVYINARDKVEIGDGSVLSAFVKINTGGLRLDVPAHERGEHISSPVKIGKNVWLATGVIVNPGVKIGDGVVVGAGSVVTKDLPEYTLCVGVPSKPIKDLPR